MGDTTNNTHCPAITKALHEVMQKCSYVQKRGKNKFHNYNYAGEADLLEVLRPAMVEAGLLLIPSVTEAVGPDEYGNTTVKIAYTLAHKDGEVWPFPVYAMGCGNDKNSKGGIGDKGTYKAITGANKYLLFKLFQIETGDDPETDEREVDPPQHDKTADPKAIVAEMTKALRAASDRTALDAVWDAVKADFAKITQADRDAMAGVFDQEAARVLVDEFERCPTLADLAALWTVAQGYMRPMADALKARVTDAKDVRKRNLMAAPQTEVA